jgi:hypothetical protein
LQMGATFQLQETWRYTQAGRRARWARGCGTVTLISRSVRALHVSGACVCELCSGPPRVRSGYGALGQKLPHGQLQHLCAAECAVVGGDEVVADCEKASMLRASRSAVSGQKSAD